MPILKVRSGGAWVEIPVGTNDHDALVNVTATQHHSNATDHDHANVQAYALANLTLADGLITAPTTSHVAIVSQTGATDNFAGISAGAADGDVVRFTNFTGDTITVEHAGGEATGTERLFLLGAKDVVLDAVASHWIEFRFISGLGWLERDRNVPASSTQSGVVELATAAEINTGSDSTRAMPVDQFVASKRNIRHIQVRVLGPDTDCTVENTIGGDFVIDISGTLLAVFCYNDTAGVGGGPMLIDIHKGGVTVLSTKMNIDAGDKISTDAGTQPVISVSAVSDKDIFTVDIDSGIHSSSAAKGLVYELAVRES